METPSDSAIKKPKRLTSVVWNHFERVRKADICYAVCLHCNKKLSGSSNSGTTHLRNHLMRCLKRSNYDVSQLLSAKRRKKENAVSLPIINFDEGQRKDEIINSSHLKVDPEPKQDVPICLGSISFDQERSKRDLARMIILHGYPLDMIEDVGFKVFIRNLQPLFDIQPNGSVEFACMELYEKEKNRVYEMLNKLQGRINLAVTVWTSPESSGYLCLKAHYVEQDWKLRKQILNFITLDSSHTEDILSEAVIKCLMDWGIAHKLFSVTYDDCFTNDNVIPGMKDRLCQNWPQMRNCKVFDVSCATQVLKLIIQDAIAAVRDVTQNIRGIIRYVNSSQGTKAKFREIAQQVGIESQKSLSLDFPSSWKSTYVMIEATLEYRDVFSLLQEQDSAFTMTLSDKEWELASSVTGYLKLFVEITNSFSNKCPTANIYFPEICDVHIQLIDWCKSPNSFMSSMALKMKEKFDKYWNKCNFSLAVAAILDPRFKMKLVEYYYPQIYGDSAAERIKDVSDGIKELFNGYMMACSGLSIDDQGSALPGCSLLGNCNDGRDRLKGFDEFLHETSQSQSVISDLDKYLEEPIFPRNHDFNILNWWKVHTPRYPVLSMMAQDVLGIPMSTVALDSVFCLGSRVLDQCKRALDPDIRQALICTQDWLRMEVGESNAASGHYTAWGIS